jgi:hypothetical protein
MHTASDGANPHARSCGGGGDCVIGVAAGLLYVFKMLTSRPHTFGPMAWEMFVSGPFNIYWIASRAFFVVQTVAMYWLTSTVVNFLIGIL